MTPEMTTQIQIWRGKARDGTLTQEEMKQALQALRGDRIKSAGVSSVSRAKKATKVIPTGDDLLSELEGL